MTSVKLFDGEKYIKKISVLGLYRDDASYLQFFTNIMNKFEEYYDCDFSYYFIENNSKDETKTLLKNFLKSRDGKLIVVNLDKDYVQDALSINLERIHTLAQLRNRLLTAIAPLNTDYTLIVDSGIYFPVEILQKMFECSPATKDIVMMSPYVTQLYPKKIFASLPEAHPIAQFIKASPENNLVCLSHWFDTFSLLDPQSITHYPNCCFDRCNYCKFDRKNASYPLVSRDVDIVDTKSAFGGFCILQSKILNHKNVKWDTFCVDVVTHRAICEHILFCDRVRTISGKRTVVLQNVQGVHRTA